MFVVRLRWYTVSHCKLRRDLVALTHVQYDILRLSRALPYQQTDQRASISLKTTAVVEMHRTYSLIKNLRKDIQFQQASLYLTHLLIPRGGPSLIMPPPQKVF